MSSKRIELLKKSLNSLKKASNCLKISLKYHAFFEKKPRILNKKPRSNCRIATIASPPLRTKDKTALNFFFLKKDDLLF
jgi:hypothetical protein